LGLFLKLYAQYLNKKGGKMTTNNESEFEAKAVLADYTGDYMVEISSGSLLT
jgi:hypothetical protein